jgi:small subunit ribosomal protein S9
VAEEVKKEYQIVGPQPREAKLWNGEAVGFGGRKTATAQVRVKQAVGGSGKGVLAINARSLNTYFPLYTMRELILEPLLVTETLCDVDCHVAVRGGGKVAQAGAVRLALGRALQNLDPGYRWALKLAGCLERDARIVERKKTGKPKARRSKQWSKR